MTGTLERRLAKHFAAPANDSAAARRLLAALNGPLPRQKHPTWRKLPTILLDWEFAPAWPRLAALAGCAVLGFAIGITTLESLNTPFSGGALTDLLGAAFESEPLTGIRP